MLDYEIRKSLHKKLNEEFRDDKNTIIIDELGLCQGESRVDLAVINGEIHGYEIKSDRDNLKRLPFQVEIYNRTLNKISLVTTKYHLDEAQKLIPDWWGIILIEEIKGNQKIIELRPPKENNKIEPTSFVKYLWKEEIIALLNIKTPYIKCKNKNKKELWDIVLNAIPFPELQNHIRNTIKARQGWRSEKLLATYDDYSQLSSM